MTFQFDSEYFFKLAGWINNANPGMHDVNKLTKEPSKFFDHIKWYNICRPKELNEVVIIRDHTINIKIGKHGRESE
jgi:hypothetical protein